MIVTFYSYKGGTGRTMALANIATLLAGRARRVLAVDFDLEAPGLWRYFSRFHNRLDQQPGLIDLLAAASAAPNALDVDWRDYVTKVPVQPSGLGLMTSGQLGDRYSSRVLGFDWTEFFQDSRGGEFIEHMRHQWREEYDFVLVDSRTGITDSGGICTIMLPDLIVPVFVSNLQSLEGAVDVIIRAQARRKTLAYDRPPAAILPILSRFDSRTEYESAQEWLDISADRVKPFYSDWLPSKLSPRQALEKTKLPYVAYFSFGETLPALTESVSDPESLAYALNAVSQLIEQQLGNAEIIMAGTDRAAVDTRDRNASQGAADAPVPAEAAVTLFLSYAEEDRETARQVAQWLEDNGFEIFRWEDPRRRGREFIKQIENAIQRADAFLVLLSPSFLASDWCRRERDVAIRREQELQSSDPDRRFIHVLQIVPMSASHAGFLGSYDWLDLTSAATRDTSLRELSGQLRYNSGPGPASLGSIGLQTTEPTFRDREAELDKVLRGLVNQAGPHFWLVVAPPQLGKSWFLLRLGADPELSGPGSWVIRRIDLREESPDLRDNASRLLARFFGRPSAESSPKKLLAIAQEITRSGRPHLCMLDSAELLDPRAAAALRRDLSRIYRLVQDSGRRDVRLALIVASRREDEWRGVTPSPRLSALPLSEFGVEVVQQALRDLAQDTERFFGAAELRRTASLVHRLTDGLPALLAGCLDWIRDEEWFEIDRLDSQEFFDQLAGTYIRDVLFSQQTLLPSIQQPADLARHALELAFRALAPHRLFTLSHLRYLLQEDPALITAMASIPWSLPDLWEAISHTSLLTQPQSEPWQQIQPAIRRLLFRYYYKSAAQRATAHSEALKLVGSWTDLQSGTEKVIGLVERLWHEAIVLRLQDPTQMEQRLSESAQLLSRALKTSAAYTAEELRDYAAEQIKNDEEFLEAVSNTDGLLSRLVEIIKRPPPHS